MNINWTVYVHITPSNKKYVGITCRQKPEYRWGVNGCKYSNNLHFWNAIQKYGWENIRHEIIASGLTHEEATKMEINLIKKYKSNISAFGYNQTKGGDGTYGYKHSPETILKMKQKIFSVETREKLSCAAKKRIGTKNPFYKKHHSEEVKCHLHDIKLGALSGNKNPRARAVDQLSLNDEYIRTFWGAKEAQDILGINRSHISQCCNNQRKSAGGYKWRFSKGVK